MRRHLVQWQWQLYPDNHRDRANLILHLLTVPLFMTGTLAVVAAPWLSLWLLAAGPAAMAFLVTIASRASAARGRASQSWTSESALTTVAYAAAVRGAPSITASMISRQTDRLRAIMAGACTNCVTDMFMAPSCPLKLKIAGNLDLFPSTRQSHRNACHPCG